MFLESNICWVSSGTVSARYCCEPRLVNGANPGMKKWSRGNGTMFTASFLRSAFNWNWEKNFDHEFKNGTPLYLSTINFVLVGQVERFEQTLHEIRDVRIPRHKTRLLTCSFAINKSVWRSRQTRKVCYFLPLAYLSWEPQASGHATHGRRHQMVQVPVCRITQLEGSEADVIESLVVDAVSFISIFNELMHWKCSVVRLHNCVRDLSEEHKEKKRVWMKPINTKFLTTQAPSFWKRIKCFPRALHMRNLRAKQSPVILDLCLRKTRSGKSHDYRDEIVFVKLLFRMFWVHSETTSLRLQIFSVWRVFPKSSVFVTSLCGR